MKILGLDDYSIISKMFIFELHQILAIKKIELSSWCYGLQCSIYWMGGCTQCQKIEDQSHQTCC